MLFYMEQRDAILQKQPGLGMVKIKFGKYWFSQISPIYTQLLDGTKQSGRKIIQ